MSFIDNKTKLYAVIGDPIGHSLSPIIHNTIFRELNLNRAYLPLQITTQGLAGSMGLLKKNFKGFNVTIPHKQSIMNHLDEIDEIAQICGAVNTVKVESGQLKGYNTDGYGFVKSLEGTSPSLAGKRVLVLGAGGAARVIVYELLMMGCQITIANRNQAKARSLKESLEKTVGETTIKVVTLADVEGSYHMIVNTTPLGMHPRHEECPVGEHIIQKAAIIYDLIYNPEKTKLLKLGEKYGCQTINGLSMLLYQGIKAQEIWLGKSIKKPLVQQAWEALQQHLEELI